MKRPFYVALFAILGSVIGAMVAWSTEFAYLTMLDYQSVDDISATLGYAFTKKDPFNYVYLIFVALGMVVGVVQGLKVWDQVYGDRIIPLRRKSKVVRFILYFILGVGVAILAILTDVFGLKKNNDLDIVINKNEISALEKIAQTSILYGVVLIDEQCKKSESEGSAVAQLCVSRPYQTEFALFKEGKVEKVVESNENGSFEVKISPGEYEVQILPGNKTNVDINSAVFSANAGERTKIEVRYTEVGEN